MNIVVEGFDGCGKDTVAKLVAQHIGGKVVTFPHDAALTGPAIRSYLRKEWSTIREAVASDGSPIVEEDKQLSALLFQCAHMTNKLELTPALMQTARSPTMHAVLSRYHASAWVYGQLDGLPAPFLELVHVCLAPAAAWLLLDAPADVLLARQQGRDGAKAPDRYEGQRALCERGVALYRELWQRRPWQGAWHVVDATQPVGSVFKDVCSLLGV